MSYNSVPVSPSHRLNHLNRLKNLNHLTLPVLPTPTPTPTAAPTPQSHSSHPSQPSQKAQPSQKSQPSEISPPGPPATRHRTPPVHPLHDAATRVGTPATRHRTPPVHPPHRLAPNSPHDLLAKSSQPHLLFCSRRNFYRCDRTCWQLADQPIPDAPRRGCSG